MVNKADAFNTDATTMSGPCEGVTKCPDEVGFCEGIKCICYDTYPKEAVDGVCGSAEGVEVGPHVIPPEYTPRSQENSTVQSLEPWARNNTVHTPTEKIQETEISKNSDVIYLDDLIQNSGKSLSNDQVRSSINPIVKQPIVPRTGASTPSSAVDIVIPIAVVSCVLVVVALVTVIVCLRKRKRSQGSQHGSPISWMRRHNGFTVIDNMETLLKNPNYYSMSPDANRPSLFKDKEIAFSRLRLMEVIGEGAFGQVYRGILKIEDQDGDGTMTVAVKLLKEGISREVREDFEREVEITSAFQHENILPLIGVVTKDSVSTPYMVFEYMRHGDLASLLRKNDPIMRENDHEEVLLKLADLVDICIQIANGMNYLASQHFVHRDLATRNCLVGDNLIVKISDFGMSRDIYTSDYYRVGGSRMLPVRWMAPECIRYGRFTTESDIWAFGVVLWEVFSFGKQPYYGHSNEEVVSFINEGILLQRPPDSTQTVYTLMLSCWRENPNARVPFCDIYKYLEEYNMSFKRNFDTLSQVLQPEVEMVGIHVEDDDDDTPVLVERDLERLEHLREDIV